jgi:hypothetical protein
MIEQRVVTITRSIDSKELRVLVAERLGCKPDQVRFTMAGLEVSGAKFVDMRTEENPL